MPPYCVVHSRVWKMQVPYLARRYRVLTWDGVGNGRSDRPRCAERYSAAEHAADALAVLDATGTDRVVVFAGSRGTHRTLLLAAGHPDRVVGVLLAGPTTPLGSAAAQEIIDARVRGHQPSFLQTFFDIAFPEPHSSKASEDGVEWGSETDMEVLQVAAAADMPGVEEFRQVAGRVTCPVQIVQGTADAVTPPDNTAGLVAAVGDNASVVVAEGAGHAPYVRDSVWFSLLAREFVDRVVPPPLPNPNLSCRCGA